MTLSPQDLRSRFTPVPGYLDAATVGLPTVAVVEAMREGLQEWAAGRANLAAYDECVRRARAAYARVVDVPTSQVAVGSQSSVLAGLVAASLPDGAEVLAVADDFMSVLGPFLMQEDRGVVVRRVPLEALADEVRPSTAWVAFSLVQSADGRVADTAAVLEAARRVGARTYCDTTQAVGWFPVQADAFDVTACSAYKWLCSPRGTAFLTVTPDALPALRPSQAGWYAGESVWNSVYGPTFDVARDARRFDVSPAWLAWVGAAPAVELFSEADLAAVHAHDVALANAAREGLGLAASDSSVVALDDPDGTRLATLASAGVRAAGRAGRLRLAFHVWNDKADVERVLDALTASVGR